MKKKISLFFALLLTGCAGGATMTQPDVWPVATATRTAPLEDALKRLEAEMASPVYGNFDQLLIIYNDEILTDVRNSVDYESLTKSRTIRSHQFNYQDPAWHPYYQGTDLHTLQSITKSVTSIVFGIATTRGDLDDILDMRIVDLLEGKFEFPHRDARLEAVTVHDLLTMRAGLASDDDAPTDDPNDTPFPLEASDDWVQFVLNEPMSAAPNTRFEYSNGSTQMLGAIMQEATGMTVEEYAIRYLFAPLGIDEHYWKKTPAGRSDALGGLYLKAKDLAKMCKLMMEDGVWNGQRLVSEQWVEKSLTAYSTVPTTHWRSGYEYGYQWWLPQDFSPNAFEGTGYGGQELLCSPDDNLVVVMFRWNPRFLPDFGAVKNPYSTFKQRLREDILPLLQSQVSEPTDD